MLADGTVLTGHAFGKRGSVVGEVVFNTGMTGYQEVLTDPSYAGQLVSFTYPELGNTGVNGEDQGAETPHARGVIAAAVTVSQQLAKHRRSRDLDGQPRAGRDLRRRYPGTGASSARGRCDERGDRKRWPHSG